MWPGWPVLERCCCAVRLRPPPGPQRLTTVTITRQDLVEIRTVSGKMGYGPEKAVISRLTGTLTALPGLGEVIDRGKVLFRINDEPVVLLFGALPSYRQLALDLRGKDVKQLKENLRALGYSVNSDDLYGASTASAVRKWQKDLGLPQTGVVELGRVYYAAGPVRVAAHKLEPGAEASGPVLTTTGTARMVTATIKAFDAQLAKTGTKARIESGSGKQIDGVVVSLSTPDGEEAAGPEPVLEATLSVADQAAAAGFDSPLRVMFTARERKAVLVVPVGALVALAEGGFGLQVVEGGATRYVAVTTGLFANGKVEVEGAGVAEGMTVGMAQ
ncbi:MAG TPA: peptidoglycan-binding domain-containing protein [Candidatus Limnocylindrales bacterium]|nr:peptidoglycan-binding domain-containing protein [Candidatus Limnocylindrales bacterium]